jgi:hypothetical protein
MAAGGAKWIWENSRASNGSLIVLLAIADECGEGEFTEMTTGQLAQKSRLSERAVQNAVRDLEALGELSFAAAPGRGRRNRYTPNPADFSANPADSAGFRETPQNLHPAESAGFGGSYSRSGDNPADSAGFETSDERSTSVVVVSTRSSKPSSPEPPSRPDVDRLCAHLADRIAAHGSKRPNITKRWKDAARLLIDNDGRTEDQIHKAIDWCQDSGFWHSNILSMPTLREKYDQLRLKAIAERDQSNGNGMSRRNGYQPYQNPLDDSVYDKDLKDA